MSLAFGKKGVFLDDQTRFLNEYAQQRISITTEDITREIDDHLFSRPYAKFLDSYDIREFDIADIQIYILILNKIIHELESQSNIKYFRLLFSYAHN